jgi:hypothetical protein
MVEVSHDCRTAGQLVAGALRRTGYTAQGKAVRLMISVIPGDTIVLRYVVAT